MEVTVESLCLRITSGGTPDRSHPEYYDPPTIPWVKTGDLTDSAISRYDEWISEDGLTHSSAKVLPAGTVLMAMYGATVGKLGWLAKPAACNQAACAMISDPARCDPRWLFYALKWRRPSIVNLATGAAQQNLNAGLIKQSLVPAFSLGEQQLIASTLGALDDKIAANDRLIALLISLADAEFSRAKSQALTEIVGFAEVADIGGGGTPKTSIDEYWNGDVHWATPTDVTALGAPYLSRTSRTITQHGLVSCSSKLYPAGSILMTSRATIGAFAVARIPLAVNQGFIVVNPIDEINKWWLFHEMRTRVDEFKSHANGATFLELPRGKFKKLELRKPAREQARAFAAKVGPLHDMAAQLMTEIETLAATRDELLPLLMSGRVRVRNAEKIVEEVV